MLHKKYHCDGPIVIFDWFWLNIILTQISWCIELFNSYNNLVCPFVILNFMVVVGYYNEFKFVRIRNLDICILKRKISQSLSFSYDQFMLGAHDMERLINFHVKF